MPASELSIGGILCTLAERNDLTGKKSFVQQLKDYVLKWIGPTLAILTLIGVLLTGLHFFIKPDLTALTTSVDGFHRDLARIDSELQKTNGRIDTVVSQANSRIDSVVGQLLEKALGATVKSSRGIGKGSAAQDDAATRDGLYKIRTILAFAAESDVKFGRERVVAVDAALKNVSSSEPNLTSVAWETMAALLHYNSTAITPPDILWIGPANQAQNGFAGLFGQIEMKDVELLPSVNGVDLERGVWFLTLHSEAGFLRRLKASGVTKWPEYGMIVGKDGSTVVLDELHARNVVFKHIRIIYGGGPTVLENVVFVNCTFDLIRSARTLQLTDVLLKEPVISFGL